MFFIILAAIIVLGLSTYVTQSVKSEIAGVDTGGGLSAAEADECKSIDPQCVLVLGCAVWADNEPSPMLRDRLDAAIALYKAGVAPRILLSGDNSIPEYSEPDCMLKYTLAQGGSHAVFMADRLIVVTQKYHLFRALKACEALGIEAKGVASDQQKYKGSFYREAREVLARNKDFFKGIIKAKPTYLGDEIPIDGDGTVTHLN